MTFQVAAHIKMQKCGVSLARLCSCRMASLRPKHHHTLLLAESTTLHARHPSPNTSKNIEQDFRAFPETPSIVVRHMKTRSRAPGWPSVPELERRPGVRQEIQEDEGRPERCRHGRRMCTSLSPGPKMLMRIAGHSETATWSSEPLTAMSTLKAV